MATKRDSSAITNGAANPIRSSFRIPKKSKKQKAEATEFELPIIELDIQEAEATEFELLVKELEIETSDIRKVLDRMLEYPWTDAPPEAVAPMCVGFDY